MPRVMKVGMENQNPINVWFEIDKDQGQPKWIDEMKANVHRSFHSNSSKISFIKFEMRLRMVNWSLEDLSNEFFERTRHTNHLALNCNNVIRLLYQNNIKKVRLNAIWVYLDFVCILFLKIFLVFQICPQMSKCSNLFQILSRNTI